MVRSEAPRQCFLPNSGSWPAYWGRDRDPRPGPHLPRPADSPPGFGRNLRSFPRAPGRAESEAPRSLLLGGPRAGIGAPTRPRPSPPLASSAELPAPTKTNRRREKRGGPRPPSPHPKEVGKRGQATTQGTPGASGRESPLSSARCTVPAGAPRALSVTDPAVPRPYTNTYSTPIHDSSIPATGGNGGAGKCPKG